MWMGPASRQVYCILLGSAVPHGLGENNEDLRNRYCVFFSHGSDDTYIAECFLKPTFERSGARIFIDAGLIKYGDPFRKQILDEIHACNELIALLTPTSITRPWILAEIGAALIQRKRIVAITYGPTEEELNRIGVLSLLGDSLLLQLSERNIERYVDQLTGRVKEHQHA
jgi:hypothetical protein